MKIGLVIYGALTTLSGGYMYDRRLVEYLREQGDTVEIISLPWRNYASHLTDNFHFRLRTQGARSRYGQQAVRLHNLDILIEDELNHPSLIHANRKPHPYPIVSLVHHLRCSELRPKWQNVFYRLIEKKYLRSVDGFIFNSQTTKSVVNQLIGNHLPEVVAYPPTDRFGDGISEGQIIERSKSKELRIIFLGNLIERKGLHTLLEALRDLKINIRLDVIGSHTAEPEYVRTIQKYVTDHHLSSFVFLHGALNNEELKQKLEQAHILVVPSSYEGFGIVYLEGMCFGLPAIGTTAGAAGEIIESGVTGFLIQPGDAQGLANRLNVLYERRDLLVEMSLAARKRYQRQPKWNQTASQIREFLRSFL